MSELKKYKLGDVAQVIGGGTPSTTKEEYWNGEIGWLTPRDLTGYSYKYISKGERNITEEGLKNSSARLIPEGTVLMTSRAPIGYLAIAGKELCTNQGFKSFIVDEDKINNEYLYYLLKSNIDRIKSLGTGSTFAEVSASILKSFEIEIPDLPTQKEIASILSSLDEKIELNLQMNQTLEAMAQAIFKEWFVNFNFPGFDGELVDGLPKGWRMGSFEELTDIKTGKGLKRTEFKPDGIYPIIGANGELGRTDEYLLDDKLLLTGRVGTLGSIKISYGKKWYSDNVLIMKPYKYFYFSYFNLKAIDMNSLNRGSTQPLVTQTDLKNYLTLIPSEEILLLFEKTVNEIFEKIFFNDIQIQTLTQTRDTLLPKLMSGQLEIS
jgi:type I restriction enzyme S subunit